MRKFFFFWWLCARAAFPGNTVGANSWQWVIANPLWLGIGTIVCAGLGAFVARYSAGAPLISLETPIGGLLGGIFGFIVTWLIAFSIRFINAPSMLYFREKDRADQLAERLRPKVKLVYDKALQNCKHLVLFENGSQRLCFRVQVSSDISIGCNGWLAEVRNLNTQEIVEFVQLIWAAMDAMPNIILIPTMPQYLELCSVGEDNKIRVSSVNGRWPIYAAGMFNATGEYSFRVLVNSCDCDPASIQLKLKWTGDWKTTEMSHVVE